MTSDPGHAIQPWVMAFDVELTEAELKDSLRMAMRHGGALAGGGWTGLLMAVGAGFLLALMATLGGLARPEHAGGLAVGGFAACWSGQWMQLAATRRAWMARSSQAWEDAGHRYRVELDEAGITASFPGRLVRTAWWSVAGVELVSGLVVVRIRGGSLQVIPGRCLPADWPANVFVDRAVAQIRHRPG
jgi:hypothetical protein